MIWLILMSVGLVGGVFYIGYLTGQTEYHRECNTRAGSYHVQECDSPLIRNARDVWPE